MAKAAGPLQFEAYYQEATAERWPALREACALPGSPVELSTGLCRPYYLDEASILAGRWVEARPGMSVLDLCAAPGGKTLVMARELFALVDAAGNPSAVLTPDPATSLVANERSATRRERLGRVLREHLPGEVQGAIRIYGHDAARWGQFAPDSVDRILLDAPCSSERHLIQNPSYLNDWSPSRVRTLAQQAYAMLLSAIQALKPGGMVVYSTCALAREENDGVVERVLDRLAKKQSSLGYHAELALCSTPDLALPWAESTAMGIQIWPDRAGGRGPLYICRLQKTRTDF